MSSSCAKEDADIERKNKNESVMQDESCGKCEDFIDSLFSIGKYQSNIKFSWE